MRFFKIFRKNNRFDQDILGIWNRGGFTGEDTPYDWLRIKNISTRHLIDLAQDRNKSEDARIIAAIALLLKGRKKESQIGSEVLESFCSSQKLYPIPGSIVSLLIRRFLLILDNIKNTDVALSFYDWYYTKIDTYSNARREDHRSDGLFFLEVQEHFEKRITQEDCEYVVFPFGAPNSNHRIKLFYLKENHPLLKALNNASFYHLPLKTGHKQISNIICQCPQCNEPLAFYRERDSYLDENERWHWCWPNGKCRKCSYEGSYTL